MRFAILLLSCAPLLAEEALRPYTDEEIRHHLATFDQSYENKELPEADVVSTLEELKAAYLYLKALDRRTDEQARLGEEILDRVAAKGLTARKRPIVNIHSANVLGEMGDPKGAAPLLAWLKDRLNEAHPNPTAVEYGFRSLAWIGPTDKPTLGLVLGYATGQHGDPDVAVAAIRTCYEWRELDGETRKRFFDGVCAYLEKLAAAKDDAGRKLYHAVQKDALLALRELSGGKTRFEGPGQAREWFRKQTTWEKYKGPLFR